MDDKTVKRTPITATGAVTTIHPKRENISFGRWAMPVMAENMLDPDPLHRKRALQSLRDYVFDSRRVASKEFASVVSRLKNLHEDEDKEVRLKVAECFGAIAASAAGRQCFEKHDFYKETLKLVEDEEESVRHAAITVVLRVSLSPVGAESMVQAGAIETLVQRLPNESDEVLETLLQALHLCCLVDPDRALEAKGLDALVPLLTRSCPKVRAKTATVIKDLTIDARGRNEALNLSAVTPLVDLCLDESDHVKAKSLAAIMMIANATEGKYKALEADAIPKIFPLLKNEKNEIRVNAIKVLTALSEAPEGREVLLEELQTFLTLLNDDSTIIRRAATKLIEVVTFKP